METAHETPHGDDNIDIDEKVTRNALAIIMIVGVILVLIGLVATLIGLFSSTPAGITLGLAAAVFGLLLYTFGQLGRLILSITLSVQRLEKALLKRAE